MIPLELNVIEPLGKLIARPWADVVTGMQVDSRRIEEGDLFVAVGGGEDFVEHALARGASAALVPADALRRWPRSPAPSASAHTPASWVSRARRERPRRKTSSTRSPHLTGARSPTKGISI